MFGPLTVAGLVALTALGVWATCQAQIAWYRWRAEEAADTTRKFLAENARLRRVVSALENTRDE